MTKRAIRGLLLVMLLAVSVPGVAAALDLPPGEAGHVQFTPDRVLRQTDIPVYGYRIVNTFPHATASYTEGLVFSRGTIYESIGRWGFSGLLHYDLKSGQMLQQVKLSDRDFGEGISLLGDTLYQLTYLSNTGYIYDRASLRQRGSFRYREEGWGMTNDGRQLIMSNGSSSILFLDPKTLRPEHNIFVRDRIGPIGFLNSLAWDRGRLYANVWTTDFIARIDPSSGRITGWIDLSGLNPDPQQLKYPYVLNGIAVDPSTGHLLVTGKCWPLIWEIELIPHRST